MRIGGGAVSIADVTDRALRDLGFTRPFWLNEIRAGRAFTRGGTQLAVGGEFSHLQLFNPVGSGVTILVHRAQAAVNSTNITSYRILNVSTGALVGVGVNLLSGQAAGVGQVRSFSNVALQGTQARILQVNQVDFLDWVKDWDFELGAGEGIALAVDAVNVRIDAYLDWIEL